MALTDDLFQSIDTIVQARIANLPYDQTIEGEIIEVLSDNSNIYKVKYQAAIFEAYSILPVQLNKGDIVYVKIPRNDFKENKLIISKKVVEEAEKIKMLPFLSFVKENNLFTDIQNKLEYFINANGGNTVNQSFTFDFTDEVKAGYAKLGIKATFRSDIVTEMKSGDYGLKLDIYGFKQLEKKNETAADANIFLDTWYLRKEDMLGISIYNTQGYINQEKVFDINNIVISKVIVSLWQDNNFIDINDNELVLTPIYCTNLQLYFGYDKSIFDNNNTALILYTTDGLQYDADTIYKTLKLRLIQQSDNDAYSYYDPGYLLSRNYTYKLIINKIAGDETILNSDNIRINSGEEIVLNNDSNTYQIITNNEVSLYPNYTTNSLKFRNSLYVNDTGDDTSTDNASSKIIQYFSMTSDGGIVLGDINAEDSTIESSLRTLLSNISLTGTIFIKNGTSFNLVQVDNKNKPIEGTQSTIFQSAYAGVDNKPIHQFNGTANIAKSYDKGAINEENSIVNEIERINSYFKMDDSADREDLKPARKALFADNAVIAEKAVTYDISATSEDSIAKALSDIAISLNNINNNIQTLQGYFNTSGVANTATQASVANTAKYYDTSINTNSGNNYSIQAKFDSVDSKISDLTARVRTLENNS